jgi:hypothetical protein
MQVTLVIDLAITVVPWFLPLSLQSLYMQLTLVIDFAITVVPWFLLLSSFILHAAYLGHWPCNYCSTLISPLCLQSFYMQLTLVIFLVITVVPWFCLLSLQSLYMQLTMVIDVAITVVLWFLSLFKSLYMQLTLVTDLTITVVLWFLLLSLP